MPNRLHNVLDALTQLLNCAVLPGADDTNANESTSGRCYRRGVMEGSAGWLRARNLIDRLFSLFGDADHCGNAYRADLTRAQMYIERHGRYDRL